MLRMSAITSYRDLVAWQKAMELAELAYEVTEHFPTRERFGLAHQMRRAAVSIPSNIAEGHRRRRAGYIRHLEIALGSHGELDTQSILAFRQRLVPHDNWNRLELLIAEVGRLMHGLIRSLESNPDGSNPHESNPYDPNP
jgi:four helix bundle protein